MYIHGFGRMSPFVCPTSVSSFHTGRSERDEGRKGNRARIRQTLSEVLSAADAALNSPISVPIPADGGGGVVHEQHKSNYYAMFHCGVAYQLTGDKKYARYVADMLEAYARLYPTLGFHPVSLSPVPGRLFWQTLNESVWLVHTAVAYDCIYHTLSAKQRTTIERICLPQWRTSSWMVWAITMQTIRLSTRCIIMPLGLRLP